MKTILITLLALSVALAGCTANDDRDGSESTNGTNGESGSEVTGTVEVTNNTTSPTPANNSTTF